ncbi:hypothetical protein ACULNC_19165 [Shigella flexneri]
MAYAAWSNLMTSENRCSRYRSAETFDLNKLDDALRHLTILSQWATDWLFSRRCLDVAIWRTGRRA